MASIDSYKQTKKLEGDVVTENKLYFEQIDVKSKEIIENIRNEVKQDPQELTKLQEENQKLKNDMQSLIDLYN